MSAGCSPLNGAQLMKNWHRREAFSGRSISHLLSTNAWVREPAALGALVGENLVSARIMILEELSGRRSGTLPAMVGSNLPGFFFAMENCLAGSIPPIKVAVVMVALSGNRSDNEKSNNTKHQGLLPKAMQR